MNNYYMLLHSNYSHTAIALCNEDNIIDAVWLENKNSSKLLIPEMDRFIKKNALSLEKILFFAANQGPAPFTSLRTVIATLNGIAQGANKPLVGVNGLEVLVKEYSQHHRYIMALLNAYGDDVYYALYDLKKDILETGCMNIDAYITWLIQKLGHQEFLLVGNGLLLHQGKLKAALAQAIVPDPLPEFASLEAVALQAYKNWQQHETHTMLLPLYLKMYSAPIKP